MRLSSIVSLVVVTASLALGGCAAEAEPTGEGETNPNVALQAPSVEVVKNDRTADARQVGQFGELFEHPTDSTKARIVVQYKGGQVDPRIDVSPSPFGQVPGEKLGALPPTFDPPSQLEQAIGVEEGFLPYSHHPKD